jgi:hypothetical protein
MANHDGREGDPPARPAEVSYVDETGALREFGSLEEFYSATGGREHLARYQAERAVTTDPDDIEFYDMEIDRLQRMMGA